jgi:mannuronan 5-epimerase
MSDRFEKKLGDRSINFSTFFISRQYSSFVLILLLTFLLVLTFSSYSSLPLTNAEQSSCVKYKPQHRLIEVTCKRANLSYIENELAANKNNDVLSKDSEKGVWILNANLTISNSSAFYINSTDTSWLKIISDGKTAYSINVFGSLSINSVKITSWNPATNNYLINKRDETVPRPFIKVEAKATGHTNIIRSEIAYMGYEQGHSLSNSGISYYGANGSLIRGNNIHDLRVGFYSSGIRQLNLENNTVHHNYHYGIDPHTGSNHLIIRNNTVYRNGEEGIICSLDCYDILIENNEVYGNSEAGVLFSRNMHNSTARNNNVHDESIGIFVSASDHNSVYNNTITSCNNGIYLKDNSSNNNVYDNRIIKAKVAALYISTGAARNYVYSNNLERSDGSGISVEGQSTISNKLVANKITNSIDGIRIYDNRYTTLISNNLEGIKIHDYTLAKNSILNLISTKFSDDRIELEDTLTRDNSNSVSISKSGIISIKDSDQGNIKKYNTDISAVKYYLGKKHNSDAITINSL